MANSASEGIILNRLLHVDLVITDLIMPDQEGLDTIQQFRRRHPAVKIIAMSGGGRINARDFLKIARYLGAGRTFAKPFENSELIAAIEELLPREGLRTADSALSPDQVKTAQ